LTLLKDDNGILNSIKGTLMSIPSELRNISSDKALDFSKWLLQKAKYYRIHKLNERFKNIPNGLTRGDVVWVDFGINVGDEFSDEGTEGHYAIIWARQGWMLIAIPLSKQYRNDNFTVPLGKITGLPNNNSYAKLDNIKAINIRRIKKISWLQPLGKAHISDPDLIQRIKDYMKKVFID